MNKKILGAWNLREIFLLGSLNFCQNLHIPKYTLPFLHGDYVHVLLREQSGNVYSILVLCFCRPITRKWDNKIMPATPLPAPPQVQMYLLWIFVMYYVRAFYSQGSFFLVVFVFNFWLFVLSVLLNSFFSVLYFVPYNQSSFSFSWIVVSLTFFVD
jgi:hypothetical protein